MEIVGSIFDLLQPPPYPDDTNSTESGAIYKNYMKNSANVQQTL